MGPAADPDHAVRSPTPVSPLSRRLRPPCCTRSRCCVCSAWPRSSAPPRLPVRCCVPQISSDAAAGCSGNAALLCNSVTSAAVDCATAGLAACPCAVPATAVTMYGQ